MKRLILAELLKLRTTRTAALFMLGVVAVVTLSVTAPSALVGKKQDPHTVVEGAAALALTLTLLLGIAVSAGDEQQGGLVNTLLVAPGRSRLVIAKALAAACAGVLLGLVAAALSLGLELVDPSGAVRLSTAEMLWTGVGIVVASPLFAMFGVGFGLIVRSQALAIGAILVWLLAAEQLISQLSYPTYTWLLGGASEALLRHVSSSHHIPPMWVGGLVLAAYACGACALGARLLTRRDLT
jgi:ABC-2 type transport system permease protein